MTIVTIDLKTTYITSDHHANCLLFPASSLSPPPPSFCPSSPSSLLLPSFPFPLFPPLSLSMLSIYLRSLSSPPPLSLSPSPISLHLPSLIGQAHSICQWCECHKLLAGHIHLGSDQCHGPCISDGHSFCCISSGRIQRRGPRCYPTPTGVYD